MQAEPMLGGGEVSPGLTGAVLHLTIYGVGGEVLERLSAESIVLYDRRVRRYLNESCDMACRDDSGNERFAVMIRMSGSIRDARFRRAGGDWELVRQYSALRRLAAEAANNQYLSERLAVRNLSIGELDQGVQPDRIRRINETPAESLRFRDFVGLRVGGRDTHSRKRLPRLENEAGAEAVAAVRAALPEDRAGQAAALRWVLRGLLPDRAIRKVEADRKVSESAARSRREEELEWLQEMGLF